MDFLLRREEYGIRAQDAQIMLTERQLTDDIRRGDTSAFRQLYLLYVKYLSAICSRYITDENDRKDILQEAFLKIWSSIGAFSYRGEGSLKAWMSKITVNLSLKHLRNSGKLHYEDIDSLKEDIAESEIDAGRVPTDTLMRFIRELPDGYRTVFNLFVVEGLSHKEIAKMLGIKENTSASQLFKAKAMMAEKIRNYEKR